MIGEVVVEGVLHQHAIGEDRLMLAHRFVGLVGIGKIGHRREEDGSLGGGGAALWPNKERNVIFLIAMPEPGGVDAAPGLMRHAPHEAGLPCGIFQIVIMEMNRAVFRRRVFEILLGGLPIAAGDRAHWHVDREAVRAVRTDIGKLPP